MPQIQFRLRYKSNYKLQLQIQLRLRYKSAEKAFISDPTLIRFRVLKMQQQNYGHVFKRNHHLFSSNTQDDNAFKVKKQLHCNVIMPKFTPECLNSCQNA
jgi:predicted nucleotidyltransferase